MTTTEAEILTARRGCAGIITLNRPKALNALTLGMVRTMAAALELWREDASVTRIVIEGSGGKAFCAGGDIRRLHDQGKSGEVDAARQFWREEYTLNHALKTYPKPVIALIDGIVMGGGVGVSCHGSHRVVTEKLIFAMPEVGIGFFPDVGATYLLPRLPGAYGRYLALTGARIGQADAMMLTLGTHSCESAQVPALKDALTTDEDVNAVLSRFAMPPAPAPLTAHSATIEDAFNEETLVELYARLAQRALGGDVFAAETLETLRTKSPTSQAIALRQMQLGATLSFSDAMITEFRIVSRIPQGTDFFEGVRAVIIDKDQTPRWRPSSIEALDPAVIDAYFAPLADDLILPRT